MNERSAIANVETGGTGTVPRRRSVAARVFGSGFILLLVYGVVYYTALFTLGWHRLFELLGQDAYNALIPGGGLMILIPGLVLLLVGTAVWALWRWFARLGIDRLATLAVVVLVGMPLASALRRHSLADVGELALDHILAPFTDSETEYAPGYSDEAFDAVELGMPEADVLALLGQPLQAWNGDAGVHYVRYSQSPHSGSYWERKLVYRDGRVERIDTSFWAD